MNIRNELRLGGDLVKEGSIGAESSCAGDSVPSILANPVALKQIQTSVNWTKASSSQSQFFLIEIFQYGNLFKL